jgi:hypothetical protein
VATHDSCRMLRCSAQNRHAPQFRVGRYFSAEVTGPEVIMTTIPEPMGHHAYGMCGDSVSAPLHRHFAVQCRLMSGTWATCQCLGMRSARCGHEAPCPMGCRLQGRINKGWNRACGSILPFSCLLRPSPSSFALLFLHNLRPPSTAIATELPPSWFKMMAPWPACDG